MTSSQQIKLLVGQSVTCVWNGVSNTDKKYFQTAANKTSSKP